MLKGEWNGPFNGKGGLYVDKLSAGVPDFIVTPLLMGAGLPN